MDSSKEHKENIDNQIEPVNTFYNNEKENKMDTKLITDEEILKLPNKRRTYDVIELNHACILQ